LTDFGISALFLPAEHPGRTSQVYRLRREKPDLIDPPAGRTPLPTSSESISEHDFKRLIPIDATDALGE